MRLLTILSGILALFGSAGAAGQDNLLAIGTVAPGFKLASQTGDTIDLAAYKGKNAVVLIFYPGDQTPGCTQQLCAIRDDYSLFKQKNAVVFGINDASAQSHKAFAEKQGYDFPLLVDAGSTVTRAYGCKGAVMAKRTVYVIGRDGNILWARRGKPDNAEILKAITDEPAAAPAPENKRAVK